MPPDVNPATIFTIAGIATGFFRPSAVLLTCSQAYFSKHHGRDRQLLDKVASAVKKLLGDLPSATGQSIRSSWSDRDGAVHVAARGHASGVGLLRFAGMFDFDTGNPVGIRS